MSRRIADLLIKIGADSYEFQQRTKQVEKSLEGIPKGGPILFVLSRGLLGLLVKILDKMKRVKLN